MHKNRLGGVLLALSLAAGFRTPSASAQLTSRFGQVTVLLPDGNILIAGGATDNTGYATATNKAELFTSSGTFAVTTGMTYARLNATGTLLPDGTVLVAGGEDNSGNIRPDAEIYDPAAQTWTTVTGMTGRFSHTATLLQNGTVLLCGGFNSLSNAAQSSCDSYNYKTKSFTDDTVSLLQARGNHTATLLTNGKVFVTGGYNPTINPPYLITSEIYSGNGGAGGTFYTVHALNIDRSSHTATLMGNGEVLITGGYNEVNEGGDNGYLNDAEIYDPGSGSMNTVTSMNESKALQSATLMPNGSVQVFGGFGNIPYTQISAQSMQISNGSISGSDSASEYGISQTQNISSDTVLTGSANIPLSISLGVQASGMIQNGVIILSAPSITSSDGNINVYLVSGSSNPLGGLYVNLAGTPVTCSGGTCGLINGNFNLSGFGGYYQIKALNATAENTPISAGTIDFTSDGSPCNSGDGPCNLTGGSLTASLTVTVPGEFVGYNLESGNFTITSAQVTTNNSTSTLSITYADAAIPNGTAVISDGKGNGLATFNATLSNLAGQVTLSYDGAGIESATMGDTYFPGPALTSISGSLLAVVDGANLDGATFNFGVSTVVINEMFFGDNECYDPATNQWAFCDRQNSTVFTGRYGHSATLLPNGDLAILGGLTCLGAADCPNPTLQPSGSPPGWSTIGGLSLAQTFNTGFSAGPAMANARSEFTSTLLPNGKILVAGGAQGNSVLDEAEIFDPVANSFSTTSFMTSARDFQTATLLVNGNVLEAGGFTTSTETTNSAEIYYPATGLWAPTSSMNDPREGATATLLPNGSVLVAGGYDSNTNQYLDTAEIYYSTSASWSLTGNLISARALHTATLLQNGTVLVVGGFNASGFLSASKSAEIYNPSLGSWSAAATLNDPVYQHTATLLPDGKVLIAGGDTGTGATTAAYLYDPNSETWSQTGSLNTARFSHTATLLPDGRVMVIGGVPASGASALSSVEFFSEDSGGWSNITTLTTARAYQSTILTADGNVHVMGGNNGPNGTNQLASTEVMYFTGTPDQESGTSSSMRLSTITAASPVLFDRGASLTVTGQNFQGNTEASGGGGGPMNSSFYAPRLVLDSLGSSGGGSSQGDSGFAIDVTSSIYADYGGINTSWQNMESSITVPIPALGNNSITVPYGWYNVRTVSNAQYASAVTVQAGPAKPSAAPTDVAGDIISPSTITWTWTPPAGTFNGFDVYSATSGLFLSTIPANVDSFTQVNLTPSAAAQITVAAYTLSGDGPSVTSPLYYSIPNAPSDLVASSVTELSLVLSWNVNGNSAGTIYEVSDSTDDFVNSFSTPIPVGVDLTTNTVEITPLNPDSTYYFRVRAESLGDVFSNFSDTISVLTTVSITGLSGAPCVSSGTTCIQWTWANPGGDVDYYDVYNATAPSVLIATPTAAGFMDSGLGVNTARSIEISAITSQGAGPLSAAATAYTLAATPSAVSPSLIVLDSGSFTGAWTPNNNPAGTEYQMEVSVGSSTVGVIETTGLNAMFNGISPAASVFNAQVAAVNQAGVLSSYLNLGSTATFAEAPSSLTVTGVSATSISLSWLASENSSSTTYQITYSTDDFVTTNTVVALPFSSNFNGNSYTLTGLSSTLIYYLEVQAMNPFGQATALSNIVSTQPFNAGAEAGTLGGVLLPGQSSLMQGVLPDGMTLTLNAPAGVVNQEVSLFISSVGFAVPPCPNAVNSTGFVIQAQPGVEPLAPYYLGVTYPTGAITFSADQATLMRIAPDGTCVPLATTINTASDMISATVNYFSEFVLAQQTPGGAANDTNIFPNPFYPSRGNGYVTFSNAPAGARIRIFTLHGELVSDQNADPSGVLIWTGDNRAGVPVASGIYIVSVEATGSRHIFKLAVLR